MFIINENSKEMKTKKYRRRHSMRIDQNQIFVISRKNEKKLKKHDIFFLITDYIFRCNNDAFNFF